MNDAPARMRAIGWWLFRLMWGPFPLIFVGMIGMPSGSYDWGELPVLTRYSLLATGVLAATSMLLLALAPLTAYAANRRVLRSGSDAEATILELVDTGTTINQNPLIRFRVEVRPEGVEPFEAEFEKLVGRLDVPGLQPGTVVQVKYDPDRGAVALAG